MELPNTLIPVAVSIQLHPTHMFRILSCSLLKMDWDNMRTQADSYFQTTPLLRPTPAVVQHGRATTAHRALLLISSTTGALAGLPRRHTATRLSRSSFTPPTHTTMSSMILVSRRLRVTLRPTTTAKAARVTISSSSTPRMVREQTMRTLQHRP